MRQIYHGGGPRTSDPLHRGPFCEALRRIALMDARDEPPPPPMAPAMMDLGQCEKLKDRLGTSESHLPNTEVGGSERSGGRTDVRRERSEERKWDNVPELRFNRALARNLAGEVTQKGRRSRGRYLWKQMHRRRNPRDKEANVSHL